MSGPKTEEQISAAEKKKDDAGKKACKRPQKGMQTQKISVLVQRALSGGRGCWEGCSMHLTSKTEAS